MSLGLGHQREQVTGEVDPAALMRHPLELPAQSGDQTPVLVRYEQLDPGQATFPQGAEETAPKHLVFAVTDVDTEDLPAAGRGHTGRDHDGHRGDLSGATDMEIGRVEEHVGEAGVVQRPGPECSDLLVQTGTDP